MSDMQTLFDKNLDFFAELQPALHARFVSHDPMSSLEVGDDGDADILFQDILFYGMGASAFAKRQLDKYWQAPERLGITPVSSDTVDTEGGKFLYDILKFADDNDITFNAERTRDNAFHLLLLGVGLGQHIAPLIERTAARNIIIVEPNFEFIYQSLYVLDWRDTFGEHIENKGGVNILIDSDATVVQAEIKRIFRVSGPACFDGLTVFQHYSNPVFERIKRFLRDEGDLLYTGLGFFEDELNMVANTYKNLKSGKERVFYANTSPKFTPVFVVGSGPSLDKSLDVIRANQDKAIVISCGTSLAPLVRGGVMPDFHIELERSEYQVKMPKIIAEETDISSVCLVASTTVVPEVQDNFSKRVYFFRNMLSSFPLFSDNFYNCVRYPSPTVSNAGLSFAQDLGFRKFYFFGIDLGFLDPNDHHSKGTVYTEMLGYSDEHHWDRETPGNFGGTVKSTYVLQWTRQSFELSFTTSSDGHTYYNCSDGGYIEGVVPLLPEFVDLPQLSQPKSEIVNDLIETFPVYTSDDFNARWQEGRLIADGRKVGDKMIELVNTYPNLADKRYITALMDYVRPMDFDDAALMMLRCSLYNVLLCAEYYSERIEQLDKHEMFMDQMRKSLIDIINFMCDQMDIELTSLQETGSLKIRTGL
ncbi:MAG: DUF115 domain-containing protein [Magnetovibrio sp.]|nr:DUF115 domain-containing protein [Magnetovibrio sp.]